MRPRGLPQCQSPEPPAGCRALAGGAAFTTGPEAERLLFSAMASDSVRPTFDESEMLLQVQFSGSHSLPQSSILLQTRAQNDGSCARNGHWAAKLLDSVRVGPEGLVEMTKHPLPVPHPSEPGDEFLTISMCSSAKCNLLASKPLRHSAQRRRISENIQYKPHASL